MKRYSNVIIGVFLPLLYFLSFYFFVLMEYSEKYSFLQNAFLIIIPAIPGLSLAFLLRKDSFKCFLKSLVVCFLTSVFVFILVVGSNMDLKIYTLLTGSDEFGMGEGILSAVTFISYLTACFIGTVISGVISCIRGKSHAPESDIV